jgi:sulfide dehydrogenase cytochrome subunit
MPPFAQQETGDPMTLLPTSTRRALSLLICCAAASAHAQTQAAPSLHVRSLAATCAACHGTDGKAEAGSGLIGLRGRDKDYLAAQLTAFKDGTRPATVMHQIAKGYTPEQIDQLAAYFAAQK